MHILINRDIKRTVWRLSCAFAGFILLSQLYCRLSYGAFSGMLLLLSLLLAACVFGGCYLFVRVQQRMLEDAIAQIDRFGAGDVDARIEADGEGSLHKLFHAVNALTTALSAHAAREQSTKDFLRNTISDISHQLKTPLAALAVYNSLLQNECGNKAAVCTFALKSEKEIDRIEALVHNLLKITRLDSGAIAMDMRPENVPDMIAEIGERFSTRAEQEKKRIVLSGPEGTTLCCDRVWLMEAVGNLVKNALDHTGEGGRIEVLWRGLPSSAVQITVRDNGSGIHPEDAYHIFKRFYRSRFSKDTQGIGLGLPIAKAIVEAHDGVIEVDSEIGTGSTFALHFLQLTKL